MWHIKRLLIFVTIREKSHYAGRFDGGWDYKLGFEFQENQLAINLLIVRLTFLYEPKS